MERPTPDTDVLIEHAGFMRALAAGILRDPGRADDVVQESLLAALRRPPPRTGNLRGSVVTDSDRHSVTTSIGGAEYALIHHKGSSKKMISRRRFAGVSTEDVGEFED